MVSCPICSKPVKESNINRHIDSECAAFIEGTSPKTLPTASFFRTPSAKNASSTQSTDGSLRSEAYNHNRQPSSIGVTTPVAKRPINDDQISGNPSIGQDDGGEPFSKRPKTFNLHNVAPLAERMRPRTLDDVYGQELVGPHGVLRGLIEEDRVPSMILWGAAGTGKTTIARLIANIVGSRFVEINSTSSGVAECKKIFADARSELGLTGRKTILVGETVRYSHSSC